MDNSHGFVANCCAYADAWILSHHFRIYRLKCYHISRNMDAIFCNKHGEYNNDRTIVVDRPAMTTGYHYNRTLQWRHNGHDGVPNHHPYGCLLNRLFRRRSKTTSKIRVTGPCAGDSSVTGEFPAQRTSNAVNVSIRWHHHDKGEVYKSVAMRIVGSKWQFNVSCNHVLPQKLSIAYYSNTTTL